MLWASAEADQFILQDDSGGLLIEMDLRNQPHLQTGQRVRVEGTAVAGAGHIRQALIDNDGLHSATEKAETIHLLAGRHPIRVDWFNGPTEFKLNVEYQSPDLPRQTIPNSVLSDLHFRCYEGRWRRLPNFEQLIPVQTGVASNFDLSVRSRDQRVALQFSGFIEIPHEGLYTFYVNSDDGSRLFLDEPSLRVEPSGSFGLPTPYRIKPGDAVAEKDDCRWTEVEGTLSSLHLNSAGQLEAELTSGPNRMYLDNLHVLGRLPPLLSWIRASGVSRRIISQGGHDLASRLLIPDPKYLETVSVPRETPQPHKITNAQQLLSLPAAVEYGFHQHQLDGIVLAASLGRDLLALQIGSEVALIEMDLGDEPLQLGGHILLEGNFSWQGDRLSIRPDPLVNNDGLHGTVEKSGSLFLKAGKHPLQLLWFNRDGPGELNVYYEGPGLPRQKIPSAALFRPERDSADKPIRWLPGLAYRSYEGSWLKVPSFGRLEPSKEGTVDDFEISVASRSYEVGLEFSGFVEVPRDGVYAFTLASDDGSLLFIDERPTRLEVLGTNALPEAARISTRQILTEEQQHRWAQVEGRITFASHEAGSLKLELTSAAGRMHVELAEQSGASARLLQDSRIRATGICQATYTTDGQRVAGSLLAPGLDQIELLEIAPARWTDCPIQPIADLLKTNLSRVADPLVHIRGKMRSLPGSPLPIGSREGVGGRAGRFVSIQDDTGAIEVEMLRATFPTNNDPFEVLGQWTRSGTNTILRSGFWRESSPALAIESGDASGVRSSASPLPIELGEASGVRAAQQLPLLTTIEQVKGLSRQEAQRKYPVKTRGIITAPMLGGFFLQDSTWAIYVRLENPVPQDSLRAGDYWEVEGTTFAEFAPNISAHQAARLGGGILPEPFHPAWDQLINGSLDTRYVEIQGVVTAVARDNMALLTRAGKLIVDLWELESEALKSYQNARVRLRGCVMPARDANNQVELGRLRLINLSFTVDEEAAPDPFSTPVKSVTDLLFFDPRAGAIERVKIAGQVVHERRGEYFLMEGTNGLRFIPATAAESPSFHAIGGGQGTGNFQPGDMVEVVGFPDLTGPSPVLREAVARRTGNAPLPRPQALAEPALLSRAHDATLVTVEARLTSLTLNRGDQVLEMQAGTRGFVGRLETRRGLLPSVTPGSRLKLTGIYAGQGGDRASGRDIDSFEILFNSPANIRVLQKPPWWTIRHTLTVVGALTFGIIVAIIWISLLRRQVEERSRQLTSAIQRHEQAERQRALELERSRIAQDLHDDLGATLTQIRLLSALESRDAFLPTPTRSRMGQVTEKSREMVASLDEIVWAVNPANDSLASLATYFCQFAEEFLQPAQIRCRLDIPDALPPLPLTSEIRHNLYLAVREVLNNVVKHSRASEIWLRINLNDGTLRIVIEDNGCGFTTSVPLNGDGLPNLRRRLGKIGGDFECESYPGVGTTCRISLPLRAPVTANSEKGNS